MIPVLKQSLSSFSVMTQPDSLVDLLDRVAEYYPDPGGLVRFLVACSESQTYSAAVVPFFRVLRRGRGTILIAVLTVSLARALEFDPDTSMAASISDCVYEQIPPNECPYDHILPCGNWQYFAGPEPLTARLVMSIDAPCDCE
jgi:hypothetical protein